MALASIVVPPLGCKYVNWRRAAEYDDILGGRDTVEKARIDLVSQTVLVKGVLGVWGIKV